MINVKTSWDLFKMQISTQTGNHKLRKNVASNKWYILRKMDLEFQNPLFNILYKMYSGTSKIGWTSLYASISKGTKTIGKIISKKSTVSSVLIPKFICDYLFITIIYKSIFTTAISHWTTTCFVKSMPGITLSKNTPDSVKWPYFDRLVILPILKDCKWLIKLCSYCDNGNALQSFEVFFLRQNKFLFVC